MEFVGIPVPETTDSGVSGSGEQVTFGLFPIDTLGLGTLRHHNVTGEYGVPPGAIGGLVSLTMGSYRINSFGNMRGQLISLKWR
ncbi:MAG: hypothetical protein WBB08_05540 [Halobacteriota archaeon]